MSKKKSGASFYSSDEFVYTPLVQIKSSKEREQEVKKLSNIFDRALIFKKILLELYKKEQEILSFFWEKKAKKIFSLSDFLKKNKEYNQVLLLLKKFEDDLFVINVLKKTNSVYKPSFSDFALRMRERVLEKINDKIRQEDLRYIYELNDGTFDEEQDSGFTDDVKNQKRLFVVRNDIPNPILEPVISEEKYNRVYDESGLFYETKYSDVMYQMFLDIIDQKSIKLLDEKEFVWENIQNDKFKLNSFFSDLFKSVLDKRRDFLCDEKENSLFSEEKKIKNELGLNKTKLLSLFSLEERKNFDLQWKRFEESIYSNDLLRINENWKCLKNNFSISRAQEYAYICYVESFLKVTLFVPNLVLKNVSSQMDKFLPVLNQVLFLEKKNLKKLLKFALKSCLFELMPLLTASVLKTGLLEMQKIIQEEIKSIQDNLFLLHIWALKKENFVIDSSCVKQHIIFDSNKKVLSSVCDVNLYDFKGRTPLFYAVCDKNIRLIKTLLSKGADVDWADYKGYTPLMKAIQMDELSLVSLLLSAKADVFKQNCEFKTAYHFAIKNKKIDCLKKLLEHEVNINDLYINGDTLLHLSLKEKNLNAFKFLLKKGANPYLFDAEGKTIIQILETSEKEFRKVFYEYQKEKKVYECLLFQGILENNKDFILKAIEKKAHLSEVYLYQKTPLEIALEMAEKEIILLLVKNKSFCSYEKKKNIGYKALLYAMVELDEKYFQVLLDIGADVNGFDIETKETLLHQAVLFNYMSFVKILIGNGACLTLMDNNGKTPVDLANYYQYTEIEKVLKNALKE